MLQINREDERPIWQQLLEGVALANGSKQVHWAELRGHQIVPIAGEQVACRWKLAVGLIPVVGLEAGERCDQSVQVLGRAGVHQIEIEGRDGRPVEHGGDTADDDEVHPVMAEDFEGITELGSRPRHGATRRRCRRSLVGHRGVHSGSS